MTDLEITKLCAEAMGYEVKLPVGALPESCSIRDLGMFNNGVYQDVRYDPLHDDAQAMALVKKFQLFIMPDYDGVAWHVSDKDDYIQFGCDGDDLNRAICECVAKMHKAKLDAAMQGGDKSALPGKETSK